MKTLKAVLNSLAAFCLGAIAGGALDAALVFFVFDPKYFFRFAYKWYWLIAAVVIAGAIAGVLLEIFGGKIKFVRGFRGSVSKKAGAAFIIILLCVLSIVTAAKIKAAANLRYKTIASGISEALLNAIKTGGSEITIDNPAGAEYMIFSRAYAVSGEKLFVCGFPYKRTAEIIEAADSMDNGSTVFIVKNGALAGWAALPGNLDIVDEKGNKLFLVKSGKIIKIFLRRNSRKITEIYKIE
jgi:hypothetical protein